MVNKQLSQLLAVQSVTSHWQIETASPRLLGEARQAGIEPITRPSSREPRTTKLTTAPPSHLRVSDEYWLLAALQRYTERPPSHDEVYHFIQLRCCNAISISTETRQVGNNWSVGGHKGGIHAYTITEYKRMNNTTNGHKYGHQKTTPACDIGRALVKVVGGLSSWAHQRINMWSVQSWFSVNYDVWPQWIVV